MLITRKTDYAIRCIVYLSRNQDRDSNIAEIARAMHIPKTFLAKILQMLVRKKLVTSTRGISGGFRLARKPSEISLMDIVMAIQFRIGINICVANPRLCSLNHSCAIHPVWVGIRMEIDRRLRTMTIDSLLNAGTPAL